MPAHAREDLVRKAVAASDRKEPTFDVFPGKEIELTKIHLPISLPVYRMANGRTSVEQLAYLRRSKRPSDFFSKGEESEEAQKAQHEILSDLAKQGSDSVAVIAKILRDSQQTQPIWITEKGVVVNGNRRLAAMRDLYAEDPKKFERYGAVECAVLPNLTPDQIEELELRLQVAPETKLPYGWVHDCLLIEKRLNTGKGEEYVASLMGRRPSDVRAAMGALKEVNIYLRDWKKSPGDYALVEEDGKQFFNDLPKHLRNKSGVHLEATRRIGWILFDNGEDLGTRLYAFNKIIGERAHEVLRRLATREDVVDTGEDESEEGPPTSEPDDILVVDLGEDTTAPDTDSKVLEALNDEAKREEVSAAVLAVCQTMFEAGRTSALGQSTLRILTDIQTRLQEIDLTKAAPDTHQGIGRQLQEILRLANEIRERNDKYLDGSLIHAADDQ
jgi:hypothetical protein